MSIKLREDVIDALRQYNLQTMGRGINARGYVTDPEVIRRLEGLAFPGEDLNDTILRVLDGRASGKIH